MHQVREATQADNDALIELERRSPLDLGDSPSRSTGRRTSSPTSRWRSTAACSWRGRRGPARRDRRGRLARRPDRRASAPSPLHPPGQHTAGAQAQPRGNRHHRPPHRSGEGCRRRSALLAHQPRQHHVAFIWSAAGRRELARRRPHGQLRRERPPARGQERGRGRLGRPAAR